MCRGKPRQLTTTPSYRRAQPFCTLFPRAAPPADVLSTVEFDAAGEQLATGDRGGRVVLFDRTEARPDEVRVQRTARASVRA